MHVFRLVNGGAVDKIIAFDSLPKRLVFGLKTKPMDGFPRFWQRWLIDNGSTQPVSIMNPETGAREQREQPCTYLLEYKMVNADIQKWQEIANYVRKAVDLSVRLMDRIEDMAVAFAKDSYSELSLEPENVPVIPVPSEVKREVEAPRDKTGVMSEDAAVPVVEKKRRGRPKKVLVEA